MSTTTFAPPVELLVDELLDTFPDELLDTLPDDEELLDELVELDPPLDVDEITMLPDDPDDPPPKKPPPKKPPPPPPQPPLPPTTTGTPPPPPVTKPSDAGRGTGTGAA